MSNKRGCGTRVTGGVYAVCTTGDGGLPLEYYLVDPPRTMDFEAIGLTPISPRLVEVDGVFHVFDWVGAEHYPNAADFLEEARRMGVSRRLPKNLDFSKLTKDSRLFLVHPRGTIRDGKPRSVVRDNWTDGIPSYLRTYNRCPKKYSLAGDDHARALGHDSNDHNLMCIGYLWQTVRSEDLEKRREIDRFGAKPGEKLVRLRKIPSGDYFAAGHFIPDDHFLPAIIAKFPIKVLEVVRDEIGQSHQETGELAQKSELEVVFTEE